MKLNTFLIAMIYSVKINQKKKKNILYLIYQIKKIKKKKKQIKVK